MEPMIEGINTVIIKRDMYNKNDDHDDQILYFQPKSPY